MTDADTARALLSARDERRTTTPPTLASEDFDLARAYRVGAALDRRLRGRGYRRAGWKVGFTNRAIWPRFGLEEPILAPVYDRTLRDAAPAAEVSLDAFRAPRLEVEVVFGFAPRGDDAEGGGPEGGGPEGGGPEGGGPAAGDPAWVALGFEIVDCHYAGWRLTPADSVADFGLHGALVVGPRVQRTDSGFARLVERLDRLEVRLARDGRTAARGRGRDVLGHPRAALDFVSRLASRFGDAGPPAPGGVVSTGTMTALEPLAPGERWRAETAAVDLPGLELLLTT